MNEAKNILLTYAKHANIAAVVIGLLIAITCLLLNQTDLVDKDSVDFSSSSKRIKAYVITADCRSSRFRVTKQNIEGAFPNFFDVICFRSIPFNDPRVDPRTEPLWKKYSSNQLAFIDLWSYVIPKHSMRDELQWSFIFEDDVNFNNASEVFLPNYISALQELMKDPDVQLKDGFIYLGICGPMFLNTTHPLIANNTNGTLFSQKGYGFCLHSSGITARRSKLFWSEIASYRPNIPDASLDLQLRDYSVRSKNYFRTFGSNFLYPPGTGHYGVAYQDRGRFSTTVA